MPLDDPNLLNNDDDTNFVQELAQVEQALANLQYRYRDLQNAIEQRSQLEARRQEIEKDKENGIKMELEQELTQIDRKIQELNLELESRLLTDADSQKILRELYWQGWKEGAFREWFWQIVRFGGLGVILGWILKSCAG